MLQNLRFFSGIYGLRGGTAVERVVETFDLGPYLSSRAGSLPLGFKQRLAMGCAVMHGPDVLFLDEPTSGVDLGAAPTACASGRSICKPCR